MGIFDRTILLFACAKHWQQEQKDEKVFHNYLVGKTVVFYHFQSKAVFHFVTVTVNGESR